MLLRTSLFLSAAKQSNLENWQIGLIRTNIDLNACDIIFVEFFFVCNELKIILGLIRVYSVSNEGEYYKSQEFEAHPGGVNTIVLLQGTRSWNPMIGTQKQLVNMIPAE